MLWNFQLLQLASPAKTEAKRGDSQAKRGDSQYTKLTCILYMSYVTNTYMESTSIDQRDNLPINGLATTSSSSKISTLHDEILKIQIPKEQTFIITVISVQLKIQIRK